MRHPSLSLLLALSFLAGCNSTLASRPATMALPPVQSATSYGGSAQDAARSQKPHWDKGQRLMQGFLGVTEFDDIERSGGNTPDVDGSNEDSAELPTIGGGAQWKLGGERIDYGFEGMFSLGWRSNATAFAVGGGGAAIAVDVDLLLVDVYGGPFVSLFLGKKMRVYGAAGPMIEFANYDQTSSVFDDSGSGFGVGVYARTGIEFLLPSRTLVGFGVKWSDSTIDLGSDLGDLDMAGLQYAITITKGL